MSDSRAKENDQAGKARKPASGPNANTPEKGRKTGPETRNAQNPQNPAQTRETKGKTWPIWLLSAILVLALAGFGWIMASQLLTTQPAKQPAQEASTATDTNDNAPVSILPEESTGVTILEKQPEADNTGTTTALAPVAQGADIATGFAMDLGAAGSFLELSRRFATIVETNGPTNFQRLEPRAVLRDTVNGLEAHLLIGPFETTKEAGEACAILVLDEGISCSPATFEGELISRN